MIISYITLLTNDNLHAAPVDIGIAIHPFPVELNVIELEVVARITKVSNDFNVVGIILYFSFFFLDLLCLSLKYVIISLMLLIELIRLYTSLFFSLSLF